MDSSNQEQRNKRKRTGAEQGGSIAKGDVFDSHGNDLIRAHAAEANTLAEEQPSMLALAALAAPEAEAEAEVEETTREEAKAQAAEEEAKGEDVLDKDEREDLLDDIQGTQMAMGGAVMDGAAQRLVMGQVEDELDRSEVVLARERGELDDLMQDALRKNALKSRDEVIYLMQRLMTSPRELELIAAVDTGGDKAIQLIEYLAEMIMEPEQLYALAAYDHADITARIVLSDEALNIDRALSPMARLMGSFAPILYQLVCDQVSKHPGPDTSRMVEEDAMDARLDSAKPLVFDILNFLRLVRSATV